MYFVLIKKRAVASYKSATQITLFLLRRICIENKHRLPSFLYLSREEFTFYKEKWITIAAVMKNIFLICCQLKTRKY